MNQDHCIETGAEEASRETIDKQATLGCDLIKALIFENGKIKDEFRWGFHLIGYSQGACLACEYVYRNPGPWAGLIAFTGGLVGPAGTTWATEDDLKALLGS